MGCALKKRSLASVDGRCCLTQNFPPLCFSKGHSLLILSVFPQNINWVWWVTPVNWLCFCWTYNGLYSFQEPPSIVAFAHWGTWGAWGRGWVRVQVLRRGAVSTRGWRVRQFLSASSSTPETNMGSMYVHVCVCAGAHSLLRSPSVETPSDSHLGEAMETPPPPPLSWHFRCHTLKSSLLKLHLK